MYANLQVLHVKISNIQLIYSIFKLKFTLFCDESKVVIDCFMFSISIGPQNEGSRFVLNKFDVFILPNLFFTVYCFPLKSETDNISNIKENILQLHSVRILNLG